MSDFSWETVTELETGEDDFGLSIEETWTLATDDGIVTVEHSAGERHGPTIHDYDELQAALESGDDVEAKVQVDSFDGDKFGTEDRKGAKVVNTRINGEADH